MSVDTPQSMESVELHGLRVHRVSMAQTLQALDGFIRQRSPHHVVTLDASMCVTAHEDPELLRIVSTAELVTPDSAGVLWACKRKGQPLQERVSGVEIVERMCALSAEKGYRIFFFGAGPGVADAAANRMRERYQGCNIVGACNGFFTADEEGAIAQQIRDTNPDFVAVALGIPKQEKWIARYRDTVGAGVFIGVGGTFDVLSGQVKRAPRWMQRLCLEWLYRLAKNPSKIGKVMTLPRFVIATLREGR